MRFKQAVFALLQFILTLHAAAQNPLDLPPCPDADKVHPAQIRTIQGEPVDGHWHEPQTYEVRMYEKTEWSMSLNEKAMRAISDFFRKNGGGKNGLNPYDPDQVDVWAEIWTPQSSKSIRINGFFYQHMERITQGDVNAWTWKDIATPHPFRFRYAAKQAGWHYVKLFANVQGHGSFESKAFAFLATSNAPTEGSLELSPNHRYYQWSDGKLFFPVGQNLLTAHFCTCELRSSEDVNGWSNKDWCCCWDSSCGKSNRWLCRSCWSQHRRVFVDIFNTCTTWLRSKGAHTTFQLTVKKCSSIYWIRCIILTHGLSPRCTVIGIPLA
jgi:hypothetical protein